MTKRELNDYEKIPVLCEECEKELELFAIEVKNGGVYWKCEVCHRSGVLKAGTPLVKHLRAQHNMGDKPFGVTFDSKICPVCRGDIKPPESIETN